ncbi:lamin tail domain-containing protein [Streptomyces sp. NPDC005890]|uniref:lamin tail domain-containing protein n=1 Tax=Streptomyces sp. NPDC005890 TaxID=3154568 RepID=UPI0033EFD8C1
MGTDYIQWGSAGSQSGYQFRGAAADVQLDGTEFVVGTFVHRNKPTNVSPSQFDVQLTVNVMFEDGSTTDLNFSFHHNETPNSTGTSPADDDLVDLQTFIHPQFVTIDGKQYRAVLSGFKRNGQIVRQFRSPEGGINFAEVVCLFTLEEPDVIISGLRYQGTSTGQADEYVEIFNKGGGPQDLTGWKVEAKPTGYSFPFPPGNGHPTRPALPRLHQREPPAVRRLLLQLLQRGLVGPGRHRPPGRGRRLRRRPVPLPGQGVQQDRRAVSRTRRRLDKA